MKTKIIRDFHIFSRMATGVACEKRFIITLAFVFYKQQCKNNEGSLAHQNERIRVRVGAKMIRIYFLLGTGISSSFICVPLSVMLFIAKRIVRCKTRVPNVMGTRVGDIPSKIY